jgi:hypothetical protein
MQAALTDDEWADLLRDRPNLEAPKRAGFAGQQ